MVGPLRYVAWRMEYHRLERNYDGIVRGMALSGCCWIVDRVHNFCMAHEAHFANVDFTYAYVNPVVAVLLGWIVLNESLDSWTLFSAAIIVAGVALITIGKGLKKSEPPTTQV